MNQAEHAKVDAIYELRDAAERKVVAELAVANGGSAAARSELLDATLALEARTQDAIDVCHECGREHVSEEPHERRGRVGETHENVIDVDFRQAGEVG